MLVSDPDTTTEAAILRAAMAGESEAFAELFRRYYPMIYAFAYRLSLDRTSAQDLAQETFIKAARALRDYRPTAPLHHWLYRICTNTVRDWQRREGRRRCLQDAAEARAKIDSSERPPEFDSAREALAALPEDLRAAVVLVYFEELNHAEAARVLGCAETTVSWRIFTAKRKLKALLTRHE
jgi:RNA polymerase sigma-70 factor (ECF subfamily)